MGLSAQNATPKIPLESQQILNSMSDIYLDGIVVHPLTS